MTWLVPSLSAASVNMLFRFRGQLSAPDDIVIVAIDDASLQRIGKWPWPRSLMATVLDRLTEAHPRAVGLDVVYAEESDPVADELLRQAVNRNGRVVLPAQLAEFDTTQAETEGSSTWLMPLPGLKEAAASVGHAHADPDVDGVLRTIELSKSDASGKRLWAFALETLRVAEQIPPERIEELTGKIRIGPYVVGVQDEAEGASTPGITIIRPNEMIINYLGPPKTFPYYSLSDVSEGRIPPSVFTNKIVLIGAVAQTMGDTRITPFIHYGDMERQGGVGMPGVEVHANVIETIRRGVWLNPRPDWHGFGMALLVILCVAATVRFLDGWKSFLGLGLLLGLVLTGSIYVFNHYFIIPPVVPMLTGFLTAVPLFLLNTSVVASRDLDQKLDKLSRIHRRFMFSTVAEQSLSTRLSFLRSILGAETAALYRKEASEKSLQLIGHSGLKPEQGASLHNVDTASNEVEETRPALRLPLVGESGAAGFLLVRRAAGAQFSESEYRLAREFVEGIAEEISTSRGARQQERSLSPGLPHNLTWKLRAVDEITAQLISRISFMNQAFKSMTDGLLIANITGQVVFANPAACAPWGGQQPDELVGKSLTELIVDAGMVELDSLRAVLRAVLDGETVQKEIEMTGPDSRFFTLKFSAVAAGMTPTDDSHTDLGGRKATALDGSGIIGLIVIINDVTKQRELERVKAETLQLVSHELRAPLTSIKGLSETLLKFPVPPETSPEILETIYSEAVRLNDLINRYLDVTRLESGAHTFERRPVNLNHLIAECTRALNGLAVGKGIRITVKLAESTATVLGDAPLLTQAVNNLLINAIKYSPDDSEVEIGLAEDTLHACIYVRDHGSGIPAEFQTRVFEKFYRLERDARSEVVGTGLGLPLATEIVERHGGQLSLASKVGEGSTFTIQLPIQTARDNHN